MSLKYYDFIAERLVACDLELLDGALKRNFGKSLKDIVRQLEAEAAKRTSVSPKMIRGVYSRLGKHRRHTANKQKKEVM